MIKAKFKKIIDYPWIGMGPIKIGFLSNSLPTPDNFLLVEKNNNPFLRIDIYQNANELNLYRDAVVVGKMLTIGFGHSTIFICMDTLVIINFHLDDYFMSFFMHDNHLFVTSARKIYKFNDKADLIWETGNLGVDGVEIIKVQNNVLYIRAEKNPPSEWLCYTVNTKSGKVSKKKLTIV